MSDGPLAGFIFFIIVTLIAGVAIWTYHMGVALERQKAFDAKVGQYVTDPGTGETSFKYGNPYVQSP
jgi:hypothetical protein